MKDEAGQASLFHPVPCWRFVLLITFLSPLTFAPSLLQAQVPTSITPTKGAGDLGTNVSRNGNIYEITHGTPKGNNLFHSFGEFSVGAPDIAQFRTTTSLPDLATSNILNRVTGVNGVINPSIIFGTIDSISFYPNANLFLMNPAGIIFGPTTVLNVGGMAHFTTADYLRLADGNLFKAMPDPAADLLLSAAPVSAFGFLGSNPAAIRVEGSTLTLATGTGLSLVGGDIVIGADPETSAPSFISAPSGRIDLVSVASPGEVLYPSLQRGPNINGQSFTTMGNITVSDFAFLSVDGSPEGDGHGGSIRIRGGQFVMDNISAMSAMTVGDVAGESPAVSIVVDGDVQLNNVSGIQVGTGAGAGRSGDLEIIARNVQLNGGGFIASLSGGDAPSGNITIQANSIAVKGAFDEGNISQISTSGTSGSEGGDIRLTSSLLAIEERGAISTSSADGRAGNIAIITDSMHLSSGGALATSSGGPSGTIVITARQDLSIAGNSELGDPSRINNDSHGSPANILISAGRFLLTDGARVEGNTTGIQGGEVDIAATESLTVSNGGFVRSSTVSGSGASITFSAPSVTIDQGTLSTRTITSDNGGTISLEATAGNLVVSNGSLIASSTFSAGQARSVDLAASDSVLVSGGSRIESNSTGSGQAGAVTVIADNLVSLTGSGTRLSTEARGAGDGGTITVKGNQVQITDGAVISAKSTGSGAAGSVTIEGTQSPAQSVLIDGGTISTETHGEGAGGNIFVNANSVTLQNGGTLSAATSGTAPSATGGAITVEGNTVQLNSAAMITTATSGPGNAGDILVKADTFNMSGGATITAQSTGAGNAGNVTIQGLTSPANSVLIDGSGSGIFTNTQDTGAGGNINLFAQSFTLQNGATVSAATSGTAASATGGTIMVNAIVQDGEIMPTAAQSVTLSNRASISASSTGPANAGDIVINAGQNYTSTDSAVTTQAAQASGGNITVLATDQVYLTNSQLNASVQGSSTTVGGNIVIDPQFVILQNSQIIAQATQGQGGSISITTNVFLPDSGSVVSASSQSGVNGTVNIQSPISQAGGKIVPLSNQPLEASALLSQRCAALASGQYSSFVVAGRYALPTDPGGWLASPLATLSAGTGLQARGEGERLEGDAQIVSLRKAPSSGLGSPIFSTDWMAGCTS